MTNGDGYAAGVTEQTIDTTGDTTSAQPDPSEVGDATVDTGSMAGGLPGLSDTANAALYPDVEHPDAPPAPPTDTQDPPPFEQRESNLLDIVRAYASGQTDWPTTKQALIDFDYATPPPRQGDAVGPSQGDWYTDVEADIGTDAPDNTWSQLQEAADFGLLSRDEFNQVLQARADKQATDQQEQSGDPKPGEGKAWSDAARAAALASRLAHIRENGPKAAPRNSSMADAADPIELPKPRRTTLLPNRGIVRHEDGRIGRVRHIAVSDLRTGHTLVNPVTGKHVGTVTGVHIRVAGALKEVDDRTPTGHDRIVSVDDGPATAMAIGARYTVFEPFADEPRKLTPEMLKQAQESAVRMRKQGMDYDTAEGHFLDLTGFSEKDADELMRALDDAYDR